MWNEAWLAVGEPAPLLTGVNDAEKLLARLEEKAIQRVQDLVLTTELPAVERQPDTLPTGQPDTLPTDRHTDRGRPDPSEPTRPYDRGSFEVGMETLSSLPPNLRSQLAMRTGLVAYRAIWPHGWSLRSILGRVGLIIVRPLWVLLLLAGWPARSAVLAASVVLAGALTTRGNKAAPGTVSWLLWANLGVLGAGMIWQLVRYWQASRNLAAVDDKIGHPRSDEQEKVLRLARRLLKRQLPIGWLIFIALLAALTLFSDVRTFLAERSVFAAIALLALVVASSIAVRAVLGRGAGRRAPKRGRWIGTAVWLLAALILATAVVVPAWLTATPRVVGFALAVVLTMGAVAEWSTTWDVAIIVGVLAVLGTLWLFLNDLKAVQWLLIGLGTFLLAFCVITLLPTRWEKPLREGRSGQ
jgi:hypothetical protein